MLQYITRIIERKVTHVVLLPLDTMLLILLLFHIWIHTGLYFYKIRNKRKSTFKYICGPTKQIYRLEQMYRLEQIYRQEQMYRLEQIYGKNRCIDQNRFIEKNRFIVQQQSNSIYIHLKFGSFWKKTFFFHFFLIRRHLFVNNGVKSSLATQILDILTYIHNRNHMGRVRKKVTKNYALELKFYSFKCIKT